MHIYEDSIAATESQQETERLGSNVAKRNSELIKRTKQDIE